MMSENRQNANLAASVVREKHKKAVVTNRETASILLLVGSCFINFSAGSPSSSDKAVALCFRRRCRGFYQDRS